MFFFSNFQYVFHPKKPKTRRNWSKNGWGRFFPFQPHWFTHWQVSHRAAGSSANTNLLDLTGPLRWTWKFQQSSHHNVCWFFLWKIDSWNFFKVHFGMSLIIYFLQIGNLKLNTIVLKHKRHINRQKTGHIHLQLEPEIYTEDGAKTLCGGWWLLAWGWIATKKKYPENSYGKPKMEVLGDVIFLSKWVSFWFHVHFFGGV